MDAEEIERLAGAGDLIAYFGYGSLVNPATHRTAIVGHTRANVTGWERHWQGRPDPHDEAIALLSVRRSADAGRRLPGLLVFDHAAHLPALDEREAGYDRVTLERADVAAEADIPDDVPLYIYEARRPHDPARSHVILRSYLEAVLQGYRRQYGVHAVADFIRETANFDTHLLDDRDAPRYPRAIELSLEEREHFADVLSHMTHAKELASSG